MKKVLALAVSMLLIPFTAFGMQMMSDGDMDSITGQSGVAISLSNIQIYQDSGGDEFWYETTTNFGVGFESSQAVGLSTEGSASFLFINAIANPAELYAMADEGHQVDQDFATTGNTYLRGNYQPLNELDVFNQPLGVRTDAAVLSIRVVDEMNSVFAGKSIFAEADGVDIEAIKTDAQNDYISANGEPTTEEEEAALAAAIGGAVGTALDNEFAAIEIGLPTLEIYTAEGSQDVLQIWVSGDYTDSPVLGRDWTDLDRHTYSLGTIYTTEAGSTTAILGGRLGITSYGQIADAYKTYSLD